MWKESPLERLKWIQFSAISMMVIAASLMILKLAAGPAFDISFLLAMAQLGTLGGVLSLTQVLRTALESKNPPATSP